MGAHEITLESYRLFLDQWARLTPELREEYSHPDQPDKRSASHIPLPERGEWMALGNMLETGEKGDRTLVIDRYSNDHDLKTGVCGMASGVMEWTSSMEKDPARVKEPPGPVACGGDWRQPGISNRVEYLRSRGERRDNLGFRIVRNAR